MKAIRKLLGKDEKAVATTENGSSVVDASTDSQSEKVEVPEAIDIGEIDVVFVIDETGSMGNY